MATLKIGDNVQLKSSDVQGIVVATWQDSRYNSFVSVKTLDGAMFHETKDNAVPLPAELFELVKNEPKIQEGINNVANTKNN